VISWNSKSGAQEHEISDFPCHHIVRASVIKDRLLTISTDGSMRFWDSKSLQPAGVLCELHAVATANAVSSDGRLFAFTEGSGRVHVAKIDDPENVKVIECGKDPITELALSPDGKCLAIQSGQDRVTAVDVASGKSIKTYTPSERVPRAVIAFHPDGRLLACVQDQSGPYLYDILGSQSLENMNLALGVTQLAFSRDGRLLATGEIDGRIQLWDFKERRIVATFKGHHGGISCLKFSPDGSILASGGQDTTILLWKVPKVK
jgi:WD40 repeat protein